MHYLFSAALGYALGCISPSYILGRTKRIDLRSSGTKNLGASNAFVHFGRFWGVFVMLFDIFKAYFSVLLCRLLFPTLPLASLIGGTAAVLGHIYPVYLGFHGGKGLASFGGFVLAVSPLMFFYLLLLCLAAALITNYGCITAIFAAVIFPVLSGLYYKSLAAFFICAVCGASVFYRHTQNLHRIRNGEETRLSVFWKKYLIHFKK